MDRILLPDTDLAVSRIGLGTVNAGLAWEGEEVETGRSVRVLANAYGPAIPACIWYNNGRRLCYTCAGRTFRLRPCASRRRHT